MKRNQHIVLLSKDHHFGLLCSWKIQQGLNKNIEPERMATYVDYFWKSHLKEHFKEEEQIIFPFSDEQHNTQIKAEHTEIERLIELIAKQPDTNLLSDFATKLHDHIRFEERAWFPFLDEYINEDDFAAIGLKLEESHQKVEDDYNDEFWK